MRVIALLICLVSAPANADIYRAVDLTKTFYQEFETQAEYLVQSAANNCTASTLKASYHKTFDAWVSASTIQFGPIEDIGGSLSITFWPDKKGFTVKTLKRLLQEDKSVIEDPTQFTEVSIAGKGLMALELLLFDPEFNTYPTDSTACVLAQAITQDIAQKANRMNVLWQTSFADFIVTAGQENNTVFLSQKEAAQSYLTTIIGALEFTQTARLKRPLGTFERARPKRAEAWRSDRPLRNIEIALSAVNKLVIALTENEAPITQEELATALKFISSMQDDNFQSISENSVRFEVESLLQMVKNIKEAATEELSLHLGVTTGFNALDGD
ncbi:imelysin family protein [Amylibacter sp. SFDW26]|uniref:imelysin family protein n=1 Tax=Amylibacter sp. SFDW26 TaxID=2652722 RepID=UPI00126280ED|nr:imelysin family protein [Amylibacter sp. SFDW26]KAB7615191.1 imelysin family protein [Amylibacter sp. SFDW26]